MNAHSSPLSSPLVERDDPTLFSAGSSLLDVDE